MELFILFAGLYILYALIKKTFRFFKPLKALYRVSVKFENKHKSFNLEGSANKGAFRKKAPSLVESKLNSKEFEILSIVRVYEEFI